MLGPVGCGYIGKADDIVERTAGNVMIMGPDHEATAQLGETVAEGQRRHIRNHRLNRQMMMEDIDTLFMTDQPSKLSEWTAP